MESAQSRALKAAIQANRQAFNEVDADGDGQITREEWRALYGTDRGFDDLDANGDGVIDAEEFARFDKSLVRPPPQIADDSAAVEEDAALAQEPPSPIRKSNGPPVQMSGFLRLADAQGTGYTHRYVELIPNDGLKAGKLCYRKSKYDNSKVTEISLRKAIVKINSKLKNDSLGKLAKSKSLYLTAGKQEFTFKVIMAHDRPIEDWCEAIQEIINRPQHQKTVIKGRQKQTKNVETFEADHGERAANIQELHARLKSKFETPQDVLSKAEDWLEEDASVTYCSDNTSDASEFASEFDEDPSNNSEHRGMCRTCTTCIIS